MPPLPAGALGRARSAPKSEWLPRWDPGCVLAAGRLIAQSLRGNVGESVVRCDRAAMYIAGPESWR